MEEISEISSQPTVIMEQPEFQAITIPDDPITTAAHERFADGVLGYCRLFVVWLTFFLLSVKSILVSAELRPCLNNLIVKKWVTAAIREVCHIRFWNHIFIISCLCAVSTAPLILYVPVINQHMKCFTFDQRLNKIATAFGWLTTYFYLLDAMWHFGSLYLRSELFKRNIRWSYILVDLSVFSLQFGHFKIFTPNYSPRWMYFNYLFKVQYVLQVIRIYQLHKELGQMTPTTKTSTAKLWVKGAFIFFIFILASHVFGAIWYFLSFQREINCWQDACGENRCENSTLYCGYPPTSNDVSLLNDLCPIHSPNTTLFDFGIFLDSLQSGTLESKKFPQKFLHCFWWGLRNLSSFGQSLQTSAYAGENLFAVFICITGMLLVLIWLNAILQTYMQLAEKISKENRKLTEMTNKRNPEIATWLNENGLPMYLKAEILKNVVRELNPHEDVNIMTIHSILRLEDVRQIKICLCMDALRKVPLLRFAAEKHLEAICEYLRPMIFPEDSLIIKRGELHSKIIFITRGTACVYERFDGSSSSCPSDVNNFYLRKGDFHGDHDVLGRMGNGGNVSRFSTSFESVKCITEVEAYVILSEDMPRILEILRE